MPVKMSKIDVAAIISTSVNPLIVFIAPLRKKFDTMIYV